MKKTISILIASLLIISLACVSVFADSYNPSEYCDLTVNLKKADPANVIKDGVIGENEYEKIDVPNDDETTFLQICYANMAHYDMALNIVRTCSFYVSWDETHGFNFAMKFKPDPDFFIMDSDEGSTYVDTDYPQDCFAAQLGFIITIDKCPEGEEMPLFYYAVGRRTTDGEYIEGHYNQLGPTGHYDPVGGQDYCIEYADGYATLEWSIPFASFSTNVAGAGDEFYATMTICNGTAPKNPVQDDIGNHFSAVGLGDLGFGARYREDNSHVIYVLSDEAIGGNNQGGGNDETGGQGAGTQVVTEIETVLTTDEEGNTVVETRIVPKNVPASDSNKTNTGKRTGDPMIIIAAISAVSACGVVVFKKKH